MARAGPRLSVIVLVALMAIVATASAQETNPFIWPTVRADRPKWRATAGLLAGALLAPEQIGRDVNKTGGEDLIAFLGDGAALGVEGGVESEVLGIQLAVVGGGRRVRVENEFGVAFPNHGEHPMFWAVSVYVYPLFLLRGTPVGRVQPLALLGIGGLLVSVDLDNITDQTPYHSWQWSVGGGLRLFLTRAAAFDGAESFLELRLVRHRVRGNGPLYGFDAVAVTLGLGMRW